MSADIFRRSDDADVDPGADRLKEEGRGPGIVEQRRHPTVTRRRTNDGYVLTLHRLRAGALEQDGPRLLANEFRNVPSHEGIEVARRNSHALQDRVAKLARR